MDPSNNQFWQFSDQLRLQTNNQVNDSIWSSSYVSKRTDDRRNFDIRVGGEVNSGNNLNNLPKSSPISNRNQNLSSTQISNSQNLNGFNENWKIGFGNSSSPTVNAGVNKGMIYSKPNMNLNNFNNNNNNNVGVGSFGSRTNKNYRNNEVEDQVNNNNKVGNKKGGNKKVVGDGDGNKSVSDKRFKTLPASESLPRNETVGGYIFVCNNDTMQENLKRQLFGLPPRYRDSVRAITPGLPLFLYNYSTHQFHGIFEAAGFGGTNIDPSAWEDKKSAGESRFPAQVRVVTRKICEPLEEDSFRPILHHYDGPKFRLELNIPEALSLLDIFKEQDA